MSVSDDCDTTGGGGTLQVYLSPFLSLSLKINRFVWFLNMGNEEIS